jgi:hypothetical protein
MTSGTTILCVGHYLGAMEGAALYRIYSKSALSLYRQKRDLHGIIITSRLPSFEVRPQGLIVSCPIPIIVFPIPGCRRTARAVAHTSHRRRRHLHCSHGVDVVPGTNLHWIKASLRKNDIGRTMAGFCKAVCPNEGLVTGCIDRIPTATACVDRIGSAGHILVRL